MKKIRSIEEIRTLSNSVGHIMTLFSGGLDSSYILEVIKGGSAKVTAVAIDLGDGIDTPRLKQITDHFGIELRVINAKEDFVEHSIVSAIQSQACYLGDYPVSSSLSRPIIVNKALNLANEMGVDAIIHTANQSQNSLRRLNGAIAASGYEGYYGSPYEYSALTRECKAGALVSSGLLGFKSRNVSGDSNLWCREFESGILDDPEKFDIPETLFEWSQWNPKHHIENDTLTIAFHKGYAVSINGKAMRLMDLIAFVNLHAGSYEIGRYVGFDHLDDDEKVLEVREAPAALILMRAYKLLEMATLNTDVLRAKAVHNDMWTQEAVEGRWGSMLQRSSYAFISYTANMISGSVTFKLSRGEALANSVVASSPKYLRDRDAWEQRVAKLRSSGAVFSDECDGAMERVA